MSKNKKFAKKYEDSKEDRRQSRAYDDRKKRGRNDASWYSMGDPDLLSAVARWPFSRRTGQDLPLNGDTVYSIGLTPQQSVRAEEHYSSPGIMSMGFVPSVGNADDAQSPINVAANAQYTFIRAANSGARNYDAPDLIIYDMAVDSIYMLLTFAARAYATVGMFSAFNKFYPDDLLKSQHIDPDSFGGSLEDYRAKLNILIRKAQSLVVSKSLPIFTRHSWMVGNYFIDGESIKQQTYLYYPVSYYKFGLDASGAGKLDMESLFPADGSGIGTITCWDLLNTIEGCLNAVLGDEDFNIMSGDILKAYGSDINTLSEVPGMMVATPVFNREALMQFKNARILPINLEVNTTTNNCLTAFTIEQDSTKAFVQYKYVKDSSGYPDPSYHDALAFDYAYYNTYGSSTDGYGDISSFPAQQMYYRAQLAQNNILCSDVDNPSPEEVMVYSRLKWSMDWTWYEAAGEQLFGGVRYTFGSEIPVIAEVYYKEAGVTKVSRFGTDVISYGVVSNGNRFYPFDINASIVRAFLYAPRRTMVYIYNNGTGDMKDQLPYSSQFDWDICSGIDFGHMYNLNQAAILSEFNVPRLAVSK